MNFLLIAIVLGIVEGVTEFLPVSSTGHLIIMGHLLGFSGDKAATFEIFIQLGAILAVVVLEKRRFAALLDLRGRVGFAGFRGSLLLTVTTLPILATGYLLHDEIKTRLFGPATVALALLVGGVAILVVERFKPAARITDLDQLGWGHAVVIGLIQCLALWPGMSRAAATIMGGLLTGLDRRTAVTYSFLAAVPALAAATLYDLLSNWRLLEVDDILPFGLGLLVSFLAAWGAVRTLVALLRRITLRPFGWYRIAVAPLVYWLVR